MASAKNRPLLLGLLLILACMAVFGEVGRHGFVRWDDEINVYKNPYLNPVTPAHLAHFWTGTGMGRATDTVYRPIVYTVYALIAQAAKTAPYATDSQIAGLDARPFHAVNLLLHVLNFLLVFSLLRRLIRSDWPAALGALLFAIHPLQVEPVAWGTGLTDLLGAFFSLLALREHFRFRETGQWQRFALATLWFALALLSKPSAVTLPLIVMALDHWLLDRPWQDSGKMVWLWLPLALASVLVARHAEPVLAAGVVTSWPTRPLIAADALALALRHLVWPVSLALDYGRSPYAVLSGGQAWLTLGLMLALGAAVWRLRRPWLTASLTIYVLALLPTLSWFRSAFRPFQRWLTAIPISRCSVQHWRWHGRWLVCPADCRRGPRWRRKPLAPTRCCIWGWAARCK